MAKHIAVIIAFLLFSPGLFATPTSATETAADLLTIGFKHAGGIDKPTKCLQAEISIAFPGFIVEPAVFDDTYREDAKGFHVRLASNSDPVFSLSCVDVDEGKESGSTYAGAENKSGEYVFLVRTRNSLVKGPANAIVGKTTLAEMRDVPWGTGVDRGCSFGQNGMKNTMVCLGGNFRALFVSPVDYKKPLRRARPKIIDKAVLSELTYWPDFKDN
jgi:hypothetical protein